MSDDLPTPPPPPKGLDLPTPPELIEEKIISEDSKDSFEDIHESIDNIPVSYTHLTLPTILRV